MFVCFAFVELSAPSLEVENFEDLIGWDYVFVKQVCQKDEKARELRLKCSKSD